MCVQMGGYIWSERFAQLSRQERLNGWKQLPHFVCVPKSVREKESTRKERERVHLSLWHEAGPVFSSVFGYFGVILLDNTLAQTHG